jgi:hypothetical protein
MRRSSRERFEIKLALAIVFLFVVVVTSWVINLIQYTRCDFAPDYRCETLHLMGVIPPVSLITVWFDTDEAVR